MAAPRSLPPRPLSQIIIALDNLSRPEALTFLEETRSHFQIYKVGLELFLKFGPTIVAEVAEKSGGDVFLDLKLHDIPNTVGQAIASLKGLPLKFLTLHLSGGEKMLRAACASAQTHLPHTQLLGVSYLTSLDQENFRSIWGTPSEQIPQLFKRLFNLAASCNISGVVLSPQELDWCVDSRDSRDSGEKKLLSVCPGIRFADEISSGQTQDQNKNRVATPEQALKRGANYLVIGRSLTQASPEERTKRIAQLERTVAVVAANNRPI